MTVPIPFDEHEHEREHEHQESTEETRRRARAWLESRYPLRDPDRDDDRSDIISRAPDGHHALVSRARELQRGLAEAGLAAVTLPRSYGGAGLGKAHAAAVADELIRFDTPSTRPLAIGLGLALPTIAAVGREDQKVAYLPRLVTGEDLWCQLFSEPDAGSDLVSLRTRAVRDGDVWRLSGQKVWSSMAADAAFGMVLARTDPDVKPQAGLTMFVLHMNAPGVSVRPLVDIAGGRHFNEVFLEDVVIPDTDVLGAVNQGWQVANITLAGERGNYLGGSGGGRRARQVQAAARQRGGVGPIERLRMVDVIARERLLELLQARIAAGSVLGGSPAVGSLMKTAAGNLEQRSAELVFDLLGPVGQAWDAGDRHGDEASHGLNASRQSTIAGGTHQIQRNLMAERLLGLPREPSR